MFDRHETGREIDVARFECRRCGECCRWEGDVRLQQGEAAAIADFLRISEDGFINDYTRLARDRTCLSLEENREGHCVFFDGEEGCRINPVKPRQCRDFPRYWRCDGWYERCAGFQALTGKGQA